MNSLFERLKRSVTRFIERCVANDAIWQSAEATVLRVSKRVELARLEVVRERAVARDADAFRGAGGNFTVMSGPFKGMRYPQARDFGSSTIFPKLLGTYELEIAETVERLCQAHYDHVVDIGCAEGYYAVGFAMRLKDATIHAFDIDRRALDHCQEMARLNSVSDRVTLYTFCEPAVLVDIANRGRTLIISDCEGYEAALFTSQMAAALSTVDLLIEVHDFIDITISEKLREAFAPTHRISVMRSIDDIEKVRAYHVPLLQAHSLETRYRLLAERRPGLMEWLLLESQHGV